MSKNQNQETWKSDAEREKRKQRQRNQKTRSGQKKKIKSRSTGKNILTVLIIAAIVCGIGYFVALDKGWREKHKTAAIINGEHEVSPLEFNYMAGSIFSKMFRATPFASQTANILSQVTPSREGGFTTMRDMLIESCAEELENLYLLYDLAKENGTELTEEDQEILDGFEQQMTLAAAKQQVMPSNMLKTLYGSGATFSSLKPILERQILASRYQLDTMDSYDISDDEVIAEYESDPNQYDYVSFYLMSVNNATIEDLEAKAAAENDDDLAEAEEPSDAEVAEDEENLEGDEAADSETEAADKEARQAELAKKAEELAQEIQESIKTEDDFHKASLKYADPHNKSILQEDPEANLVKQARYQKLQPEMAKWLFAEERNEGDTTVISANGSQQIIYFVKRAREDRPIFSSRHILILDEGKASADEAVSKKKAEEILAEYEAGEKTEETFAELAKKHTDDPGSKENGGLYEDVPPGQFVPEYEEFCLDPDRKPADVGIVRVDNPNYSGYHIIYFIGTDKPVWQSEIRVKLADEKFKDWEESQADKLSFEPQDDGMKYVLPVSREALESAEADIAQREAELKEAKEAEEKAAQESDTDVSEDTETETKEKKEEVNN